MRACAAIVASLALALAAGCGGSSHSGTSATTAASATTGTSSLKVITSPKYVAPPPSASVQSGNVAIAYRNIAIHPDAIRAKVGTKITWTNYDPIGHNVTSTSGPESFRSHTLGDGASFSVTVTKPGVIHYECTIHPASMNGTIEVVR
jgi:plastocyanin